MQSVGIPNSFPKVKKEKLYEVLCHGCDKFLGAIRDKKKAEDFHKWYLCQDCIDSEDFK
jgi:hypothetical protein